MSRAGLPGFKTAYELDQDLPKSPPAKEDQLFIKGVTLTLTVASYFLPKDFDEPVDFSKGKYAREVLRNNLRHIILWVRIFEEKVKAECTARGIPEAQANELVDLFIKDPDAGLKRAKEILPNLDLDNFRICHDFLGYMDEMDRRLFDEGFMKKTPYAHFELTPVHFRNMEVSPSGISLEGFVRAFVTLYETGALSLSLVFTILTNDVELPSNVGFRVDGNQPVSRVNKPLTVDDLIFFANLDRIVFAKGVNQESGKLESLFQGTLMNIIRLVNGWNLPPDIQELESRLAYPPTQIGRMVCVFDLFQLNTGNNDAVLVSREHIWEIQGMQRLDITWRVSLPSALESLCFSPMPEVAVFSGYSTCVEIDLKPSILAILTWGADRVSGRVTELLLQKEFVLDLFDQFVGQQVRSLRGLAERDYANQTKIIWKARALLMERLESVSDTVKHLKEVITKSYFQQVEKIRGLDVRERQLRSRLDELGRISTGMTEIVSTSRNAEISERTERTQRLLGIISAVFGALVVASIVLSLAELYFAGSPEVITIILVTAVSAIAAVVLVITLIRWKG